MALDELLVIGFSLVIAYLLIISVQLGGISRRLKQQFPTEKERDSAWAQRDPMGHWEAHKNDNN